MSTDEIRAIELLNRVSYGRLATSMRALPFVAPVRHVVVNGRVVIRMHRGLGYHQACSGSVVAYGADNLNSGAERLWSVQFIGTAEITEPTPGELAALGTEPRTVDGEPFEPVYMRIEPQFVTVHHLDYSAERTGPQAGSEAAPDASEPVPASAEAPAPPSGRPLHHVA
ncbi:pyridoxamine 5'-phosphate oxidase family protein [Streptomyces sp. NPDC048623]|uniref:pyridoxamine 5'-phosphate oxidase family protein n=1 Tax=Streptomyces sp. NPDC048623 TaxID=3155761 RepID=UPI00344965EE